MDYSARVSELNDEMANSDWFDGYAPSPFTDGYEEMNAQLQENARVAEEKRIAAEEEKKRQDDEARRQYREQLKAKAKIEQARIAKRLEAKVLMKFNLVVTKTGVVKKKAESMDKRQCKGCRRRMMERMRPNSDRCAAVNAARKLGFAIENRQSKEAQPMCLCPYCGVMNSESIGVHALRHSNENIDTKRLITYCGAVFSRNARGPVNMPKLREMIKMAILESDGDKTLDAVLKNAFNAFGVATSDSECSSMPLYDMKSVFIKGSRIPRSHMMDVLSQADQELQTTDDEDDSDSDI